jgi:hypothetical protein
MDTVPQHSLPKLMDLDETASVCHVSAHTIRAWVRQKRLKPVRICRRLLFHPEELVRFIRDAQNAPQSSPANVIVPKGQHDPAESLASSPRVGDHLTIRGRE